ncbi:hypothetical protein MKW98_020821 [Papaver atlanticum]|uniref:Uncharacterized protein n=1 Tax=Papaver atlanticum TaxID=357466 RepID=A0AAD4XXK4_9MAGN|nr:hypothetical protein MKW98_020821 [Papaver atlanticum]
MSLFPNHKHKREEGEKNDQDCPCKIRRTTNLPDDCLNLIYKYLKTRDDRNSFGITCRDWLRIRDNNQESLWYHNNYDPHHKYEPASKYPKISPESLAIITCKLLIRFQHLKILSLGRLPRITDVDTLNSQSFVSNVQTLLINPCSYYSPEYSDIQLSMIFSWFPRLTCISLRSSGITDKGLETLAKCCSSLKTVNLEKCCSITDLGLSCVLQNCRELRSLDISWCSSITGSGFLGCAHTLTKLAACECKLTLEVIKAIVSGGELEYLYLETVPSELAKVDKGCIINTEAVLTISNGCPLLKDLFLSNCEEVELEGYEAIGMNCKELEQLYMMGCQRLCDMGLQAICDGCNKLIEFYIDGENNSCSSSILEHYFDGKKPEVILWS